MRVNPANCLQMDTEFMSLRLKTAVAIVVVSALTSLPASSAEPESRDLLELVDVEKNSVKGRWQKDGDSLRVAAESGARLTLPVRPRGEYDFRVTFTRRTGAHSIALMFVSGGRQATFEIDAWGQNLAGIQNIDGRDMRQNGTVVRDQKLTNGQRYTAEVRVRRNRIEARLNNRVVTAHESDGSDLSPLDSWALPDRQALGIGAWDADTIFHSIELREVSGNSPPPRNTPPRTVASTTSPSRPKTPPRTPPRPATGKQNGRVLIVIATEGFFYREYGDPRQELERAGIKVEVAAARRQPCQPHANSGQGADGGIVRPDLAIADVDPERYDAILFSGGWGSSMYQFAFEGSYSNRAYNGDRRTKEVANRLINTFVEQDKYVAGLCHGVSVLAWSRVNGRSLLTGRRATGPTRQGPAGIYNGRQAQPPSRWNSEVNGARMVPPNSVGNRSTAADDIVIDGKILTGQDDISAREMGRQLVRLLREDR